MPAKVSTAFFSLSRKQIVTKTMSEECFVVGSMQKPCTVEVFSGASGKHMRGIQADDKQTIKDCFDRYLHK